jgi:glyoxylase-like metal-dependent hydrolase (beta-lactamase superfamily II)
MAYNSYIIKDEKIAVMDTIDVHFADEWLGNVKEVLAGKTPDYLVVHHMEPDHSASIAAFAEKYPNDGITQTTLINTGWKGSTLDYNNYYVDISSGGTYSTPEEANNIVVQVEKKGQTITLEAKRAKVASKVCVGPDYKWCAEREDIDAKYHKADGTKLFQQYVIGKLGDDWNAGTAWYQQK